MTIPIGSMTANFSNADIAYTGIGMRVTDTGSSNGSKLLHLTAEQNTKFVVYKDGGIRINSNIDQNSNVKILHITNRGRDILSITPNNITYSQNVVFQNTISVKSYVETLEYAYVNTVNNSLTIDLSKASVFKVSHNGYPKTISSIAFKPANDQDSYYGTESFFLYSCILIMDGGITITNGAYTNAYIQWASNVKPTMPTSAGDMYSFSTALTNNRRYSNMFYQEINWRGIILGEGFASV